jgi:endo-1,4-beta-xylanase
MKSRLIKLMPYLTHMVGAILITGVLHFQLSAQGIGQPRNTNGSFENTEPGIVTDLANGVEGWLLQLLDGAQADFEIVEDTTAPHGNRALKITPVTLGTNQWSIQAVGDSIPVVPGEAYRLSIWAKSEEPGGQINVTIGNYAFQEYGAIRPATITEDGWQEFVMDFTITDNEEVIRAPIHFNYAANSARVLYIDDLRIVRPDDFEIMALPIIVEAESGDIGEDFEVIEEDGVTFVRITNDFHDISDPTDPEWQNIISKPISENHVITYEVDFPAPGIYNLFVRARVGPEAYEDDSFFYPEGFGEKDVENVEDWRIANQMDAGGFANPEDFVVGRGGAGIGIWKWINISEGDFHVDGITFVVEEDDLTQTFQIGGRETGFDIDKFAFGRAELFYTVERLDSVRPGLTEMEEIFIYEGPPLATGHPKYLGNIWANAQVPSTPPLFESYWNQVAPENAGKWGSVAGGGTTPDPATWNWGALDAAYALAKDNGWPFRFHVLVWGSQQPPWIDDLSEEEQLEAIENWFLAVAERYPDIERMEVVNEPIPAPPSYREALGGTGETGWDWVITAFEMAREIFPATTKLMINDYGILSGGAKLNQYLSIIDLLIERDLIDAIGVQGHHFTMQNITPTTLNNSLNTLAATGLPVVVTEYDVAGRNVGDANVDDPSFPQDQSDATQLETIQRTFTAIWEHPAVEGVTLWGWRLGGWRPGRQMHLIRSDGSERPALTWLREYMDTLTVSVRNIVNVPQEFRLYNNYPNPFNPSTQIRYYVPETVDVTLKVYDMLGRHIRTMVDERQMPGQYTVTFNANNLSSGIYMYRLQAGSFVEIKRMTYIK